MAKRILPNRMRYDVAGKPGQDFSSKIDYSDDSKMSIHSCNTFLGLSSSCSQLARVKHVKFNHVLDTIFLLVLGRICTMNWVNIFRSANCLAKGKLLR